MSAAPIAGTLAQTGSLVARAISVTTSRASAVGSSVAMIVGVATTPSINDAVVAQRMSSSEVVARKILMSGVVARGSGGEVEVVGVGDLLETQSLRRSRRRHCVVCRRDEECFVLLTRPFATRHVEHRTDEKAHHVMQEPVRLDVEHQPAVFRRIAP